jgi:hypothetical protein
VIAIYIFIDDVLKKIKHKDDKQVKVTDAEVITIALISALYFYGHQERAMDYFKSHKIFSNAIGKSRFNRRLHRLDGLIEDLFLQLGNILKELNTSKEYMMDSFPVSVCHNIRISNCRLLPKDEAFRGKCVSKREYFYGIKIQMIATQNGVPVEYCFVPGCYSDAKGMHSLPYDLPENSRNICDSAYTNYVFEDILKDAWILHDSTRKSNSKRKEPPFVSFYKNCKRKLIECVFSVITRMFPKKIHATTFKGFLLKLKLWILGYTCDKAFL